MWPVLQIGPFALQTALLATILAVWAGLALSARLADQRGVDGDHLYNGGLLSLAATMVAARLAHIAAFAPAYLAQPLEMISPNPRAFLWLPGLAAGLIAGAWYIHRHRLHTPQILDLAAPGFLAAIAIRSAGNLLSGEAPGAPTGVPWAINVWGVARHPSQIYEMLAALVVLVAVLGVLRRSVGTGTAAWTAVLGYGLSRLALEPFRAGSATLDGGLRTAQILGLLAALAALWALRSRSGRQVSDSDAVERVT
jgi:phosphatidylglycerol---prolipoprotein diacylglyceryl transferase